MRICAGASRRVLLVGNVAIKFARLASLRPFVHIWWLLFHPELARRKYESLYRRPTFLHSLLVYVIRNFLFHGLIANRQEYRLWQEHSELPIAQVRGMYLGGFILVMDRGEPAPQEIAAPLCARYPGGDLEQVRHICLFQGTPRYVDYGHADAPRIFGIV